MKTSKWLFLFGLGLSIVLISCNQTLSDGIPGTQDTTSKENAPESSIAKRVQEMKANGLLDSLTTQGARSAVEDSAIDIDKINYFISNTDEALAEIALSDDGDVQLRLLDAMFNGGTVGEIADIMAQISDEMADSFLATVESQVAILDGSDGQARSLNSNIRDIKLGYSDRPTGGNSRAIFAGNFNSDTLAWYAGMCATTIAGISAYKFCGWWQPWVGVAGLVTAGAGAASMTGQLAVWVACTEFFSWIQSFVNRDAVTANEKANTGTGVKMLGIAAGTAGVVGYCYLVAPEVCKIIVSTVETAWYKITGAIKTALPPGVSVKLDIWGIAFKISL
jgi:hypothetical protein